MFYFKKIVSLILVAGLSLSVFGSKLPVTAVDSETLLAITENAEMVKDGFSNLAGKEINYSLESVQWVSGFIERNRDDDPSGLIDTIGSYFGEAIISEYGGKWVVFDEEISVAIKDNFVVFPFSKVIKQFRNGEEDSISMYFSVLPLLLKDAKKRDNTSAPNKSLKSDAASGAA